ncbi:hypothetical protein L1987_00677 [Smallanthus sonchifolius]|uniref:Uncharacterized protein n=1 Tax=Smallanthus sonchifolius TaxID=185202 RepID=A0ACB9K313_9ASTR|nr:hypothetical protein L1987_00677 [Smallanthus sonchifolius]
MLREPSMRVRYVDIECRFAGYALQLVQSNADLLLIEACGYPLMLDSFTPSIIRVRSESKLGVAMYGNGAWAAGVGEDAGVDGEDVSHGEEGGGAGTELGGEGGVAFVEFEAFSDPRFGDEGVETGQRGRFLVRWRLEK